MKQVRQPWMIRAAFAVIAVGLILASYFLGWMWLYRRIAEVAPAWMLAEALRGNVSLLESGGVIGFTATAIVLAFKSLTALFRLLRIPVEVFYPGSGQGEYPLHRRRLSDQARTRAGQEGHFDEALRKFGAFARSPLTPPARKRD